MCVSRFLAAAVLLLSFMYSFPDQADARQWRPEPSDKATDYAQIMDQRSENELVMVWWVVPESAEPTPDNELARSLLQEYMAVGVVHANMSAAGQFTFRTPTDVLVQTGDEKERRPLAIIPPALTGFLAVVKGVFISGVGPFGTALTWYVFDGKGIESCQKGAVWVVYASEKYLYETPIPGCP